MFNESEKENIKRIRDYYGLPNQILKTCEELSELSTALLHYYNKNGGEIAKLAVTEEITDVYVMLEQIKDFFASDTLFHNLVEYKTIRELNRIKEYETCKTENMSQDS